MQILKKNPFTAITGVNTLFIGLMNQEVFKNLDFSKMKLALGGGMAVQDVSRRTMGKTYWLCTY